MFERINSRTILAVICSLAIVLFIAAPTFAQGTQYPASSKTTTSTQQSESTQSDPNNNAVTPSQDNRNVNGTSDSKRVTRSNTLKNEASNTSNDRSLPRTGSEMPLVGLIGMASLTASYLVRRFRK